MFTTDGTSRRRFLGRVLGAAAAAGLPLGSCAIGVGRHCGVFQY